jgi:UV DNA damage endonuclease
LQQALAYCAAHQIKDFRVNSQILPVKTHPAAGYDIAELPDAEEIVSQFKACGKFALQHDVRMSFHPDQFVVLNSPKPEVIARAIEDIEYHNQVANWIGADVINIHAGGVYGNKPEALKRLSKSLNLISDSARRKLTLENDDKSYTPSDLLSFCRTEGIPLVYDVHHHRCLPDEKTVEEVTEAALSTWNREPLFHISSPKEGWNGPKPSRHHDYIDLHDFPDCWRDLDITIEVEAKAKELAVLKLLRELYKE